MAGSVLFPLVSPPPPFSTGLALEFARLKASRSRSDTTAADGISSDSIAHAHQRRNARMKAGTLLRQGCLGHTVTHVNPLEMKRMSEAGSSCMGVVPSLALCY